MNKNLNTVEFTQLSRGDVFKDKNSNINMKIELTLNGRNDMVNVVNLSTGSLDYFCNDEKVEKVNCQLVIECC